MASLAATEPGLSPSAIPSTESVVPACMFAPERGYGEDVSAAECYEDGEDANGESEDHLDFTSKVGRRFYCNQSVAQI